MPPLHDFLCRNCNEVDERFVPRNDLARPQRCHCGQVMEKVFLRAPIAFIQQDYCYDSPVDGRPITNYQQHLEELARTDSVVYEPGIKQDQERNQRMRDEMLERSIDETVEREVASMPARKKEKLAAELEGGLAAEPERITPSFKK
jgi:hypothetical protein